MKIVIESHAINHLQRKGIILWGGLRKESIEMHIHLGYLSIYKYLHWPFILKFLSII